MAGMQSDNLYQCPWPLASLICVPVVSTGAQAGSLLGPLPHLSSFALQPEKQTKEYTPCPQARAVSLNVRTIQSGEIIKHYILASQFNAKNILNLEFF